MRSKHILTAAAVSAATFAAPSAASAAEQFAAVTNSNKILTFASDSPGNIDSVYPLTGLAAGEKIVGLDTRPRTGQLYGLGRTGRIYVIDAASGATRSVAGPITPVPTGTTYGFNFNPTVDRIRITTDTRQNLRVNPDNGATVVDAPLAYAPGQGGGAAPAVGGVAYTNPVPTATATQLFDLEAGRDALTLQNPANSGQLTTVGNGLGQAINGPSGFDISTGNVGWATYKPGGQGSVNLFRVNLAGGTVANAAAQPAIGTRGAVDDTIAIATLGAVADDRTAARLVADMPTSAGRVSLSRGRSFAGTVSLNESGRVQVDMRVGRTLVAQGKGEIFTRAGTARIRVTPTSAGRSTLRRGFRTATLRISARDRAGNLTRLGARRFTLR